MREKLFACCEEAGRIPRSEVQDGSTRRSTALQLLVPSRRLHAAVICCFVFVHGAGGVSKLHYQLPDLQWYRREGEIWAATALCSW